VNNAKVDCSVAPKFLYAAWISTNIPTAVAGGISDCTTANILYSYNTTAVFGKICMPFYATLSSGSGGL